MGWIVDDVPPAIEAVRQVHELDRRGVREAFERRFTVTTITDKCLHLFERLQARKPSVIAQRYLEMARKADRDYRQSCSVPVLVWV